MGWQDVMFQYVGVGLRLLRTVKYLVGARPLTGSAEVREKEKEAAGRCTENLPRKLHHFLTMLRKIQANPPWQKTAKNLHQNPAATGGAVPKASLSSLCVVPENPADMKRLHWLGGQVLLKMDFAGQMEQFFEAWGWTALLRNGMGWHQETLEFWTPG